MLTVHPDLGRVEPEGDLGRWWDNQQEVDVVAADEHGPTGVLCRGEVAARPVGHGRPFNPSILAESPLCGAKNRASALAASGFSGLSAL